jgi:hypothetical protein
VPIGAAIERPVVEQRELAIGRRMDIDLDDSSTGVKGACIARRVFSNIRVAVQVSFVRSRSSKRCAMPRCARRSGLPWWCAAMRLVLSA